MKEHIDFTLFSGDVAVADVVAAFCMDNTWHGKFISRLGEENSAQQRRLAEFIRFCIEWNRRCETASHDPPDAEKFDQFSDVIQEGLWTARSRSGEILTIADAPMFATNNEVSWRLAEQ